MAHQGETCDELRDVFVRNCLEWRPQPLVLFRAYETWQSGLVQATLDARQEKAHVSKRWSCWSCALGWSTTSSRRARAVQMTTTIAYETLKDGTSSRAAGPALRVKTRCRHPKCLREHGAFATWRRQCRVD